MNTNRKTKNFHTTLQTHQNTGSFFFPDEEAPQQPEESWSTPDQKDSKIEHHSKNQATRSSKREQVPDLVIPKPIRKRAWTPEEDETLRQLVA